MRLFHAAIAASALFWYGVPARASDTILSTLTFHPKATIFAQVTGLYEHHPGGNEFPTFSIYGGGDIVEGSTAYGGESGENDIVDKAMFLGVTDTIFEGPTQEDTDHGRHLVLGVNTDLAGQDFASLFAGYSEQALMDAVIALHYQLAGSPSPESALVFGFEDQYAGQYGFSTSGTGYLTSFSRGVPFGTITTHLSVEGPVPEPASWGMMILGLGLTGGMMRRHRLQGRRNLNPRPGSPLSLAIAS